MPLMESRTPLVSLDGGVTFVDLHKGQCLGMLPNDAPAPDDLLICSVASTRAASNKVHVFDLLSVTKRTGGWSARTLAQETEWYTFPLDGFQKEYTYLPKPYVRGLLKAAHDRRRTDDAERMTYVRDALAKYYRTHGIVTCKGQPIRHRHSTATSPAGTVPTTPTTPTAPEVFQKTEQELLAYAMPITNAAPTVPPAPVALDDASRQYIADIVAAHAALLKAEMADRFAKIQLEFSPSARAGFDAVAALPSTLQKLQVDVTQRDRLVARVTQLEAWNKELNAEKAVLRAQLDEALSGRLVTRIHEKEEEP